VISGVLEEIRVFTFKGKAVHKQSFFDWLTADDEGTKVSFETSGTIHPMT